MSETLLKGLVMRGPHRIVFLLALSCLQGQALSAAVTHSYIFMIHEDSNYSYYLPNDKRVEAYDVTFEKARNLARSCDHCEVFIFRQRSKKSCRVATKKKKTETAYYYREGALQKKKSYARRELASPKDQSIEFYRRHSAKYQEKNSTILSFFLYFGHHIPEQISNKYSLSQKSMVFSIRHLRTYLRYLAQNEGKQLKKPFQGIFLATCKNGTPYTVHQLSDLTDYVLASPDNLHLSYLQLSSLHDFVGVEKEEVAQALQGVASHSFEYLTAAVNSVVSLALYETDQTLSFTRSVQTFYAKRLLKSSDRYGDCGDIPGFPCEVDSSGVRVYFKAPKFGCEKNKESHSGWSCVD